MNNFRATKRESDEVSMKIVGEVLHLPFCRFVDELLFEISILYGPLTKDVLGKLGFSDLPLSRASRFNKKMPYEITIFSVLKTFHR